MFLEAEGPLGSAPMWQSVQPLQGSLLEGVARLPKQLLGEPSHSPSGPVHSCRDRVWGGTELQ